MGLFGFKKKEKQQEQPTPQTAASGNSINNLAGGQDRSVNAMESVEWNMMLAALKYFELSGVDAAGQVYERVAHPNPNVGGGDLAMMAACCKSVADRFDKLMAPGGGFALRLPQSAAVMNRDILMSLYGRMRELAAKQDGQLTAIIDSFVTALEVF